MNLEEQTNRIWREYRQYAALDEVGQEAFWQNLRTELANASEQDKNLQQQAVVANLETIRQRLAEIKQKIETSAEDSTQVSGSTIWTCDTKSATTELKPANKFSKNCLKRLFRQRSLYQSASFPLKQNTSIGTNYH